MGTCLLAAFHTQYIAIVNSIKEMGWLALAAFLLWVQLWPWQLTWLSKLTVMGSHVNTALCTYPTY